MAKRFIDSEMWDKASFNESPSKLKLLALFIFSKCDCVGVFKMSPVLISAYIGETITREDILSIPADIEEVKQGVFWLSKFCDFQYGELTEKSRPHLKYIKMLKSYRLFDRVSKGYPKGIDTLEEKEQEQEEEKEEEKDKEKEVEKHLGHAVFSEYVIRWNTTASIVDKPIVKKLSSGRSSKLNTRILEGLTVEIFEEIAEKIKKSDFLKKSTWCNFDWLIANDTNYNKILEGNYDDNKDNKDNTGYSGSLQDNVISAREPENKFAGRD